MAETVKKSRIVSEAEEDLEESLLEEFNLRLKKCMSRDDLQNEPANMNPDDTHVYENIEIIKANGTAKHHHSQEFIETEREHYDDENTITSNGHQENGKPDDLLELELESTKTDDEVVEEVRPAAQKPSLNLPTTCLIDTSESFESDNPDGSKSVKDRMFLSTDDASCLLFTQTVTSPMLTPSEENIDFLKGFRRESSQYTLSENSTNSKTDPERKESLNEEGAQLDKPKDEVIYENTEFLKELNDRDQNLQDLPILVSVENFKEPVDLKQLTSKFIEMEGNKQFDVDNQEIITDIDLVEVDVPETPVPVIQTPPTIIPAPETSPTTIEALNVLETSPIIIDAPLNVPEVSATIIQAPSVPETVEVPLSVPETFEVPLGVPEAPPKIPESLDVAANTIPSSEMNENVKNLKSHFMKTELTEPLKSPRLETSDELDELKSLNIMKQISKFESTTTNKSEEITNVCSNISVSTVTESRFTETTTEMHASGELNNLKKKKSKKSKNQHEKENISVKSSFSKFDALQKKNVLNSNAPEHDNVGGNDALNCKLCGRPVFQMEKIIAERCIYHRNCFRCVECSKQLLVDTFETHEGTLYCKPHFRALFTPRAVEDDTPSTPRKHELIIRENQPAELPPDVVRASDKPDLGLEELHSLNVKERFQVFENAKHSSDNQLEKNTVKMERSPSILSKLARFQAKGMNVGVSDEALNGVPIEISDSEEEEPEEEVDGEDADLIRAKRVQKEKPFHFSQMNDVKSIWEQGNPLTNRDERREERKQEIQNIRSKLFMGKQGKMKDAYQQAIAESQSANNLKKEVPDVDVIDARSIKDKFEKGEVVNNQVRNKETEDMSVFESAISKKSRSIFQELDSSGGKPPKVAPSSPPKLGNSVRSAREAYLAKQSSEDCVKSTDQQDEITVRTADIQDRFKFFETYKEPSQSRREFRMTPPREGQMKSSTPEREVYVDPDIVRSDEYVEDSVVAKATHTATKMLNKFRQMEENLQRGQDVQGPKPLKRFTPPREPLRRESSSEGGSGSEESEEEVDYPKMPERDLLEAQKAARAKQLKAKFERWEETTTETEVRRDSQVNLAEECGDDQSQIETARSLRAKFESLRDTNNGTRQSSRVKVNRFV